MPEARDMMNLPQWKLHQQPCRRSYSGACAPGQGSLLGKRLVSNPLRLRSCEVGKFVCHKLLDVFVF
jgi:hypothetical protein